MAVAASAKTLSTPIAPAATTDLSSERLWLWPRQQGVLLSLLLLLLLAHTQLTLSLSLAFLRHSVVVFELFFLIW